MEESCMVPRNKFACCDTCGVKSSIQATYMGKKWENINNFGGWGYLPKTQPVFLERNDPIF